MRERLSDYQEQYGDLYNLEATPAESTTYRFAKHDKELFPDIITANMNGTPYYTNSSHLPVGYTEDIFSALDIQDDLQTLYTSGTVFHAFLGEKLPDWKSAATLVRKIAENYKLPYYTMSPTYSVCRDHGYISGEAFSCPICGKKTEVYSRITGYYRPVQNWNDGKAQEYKDRRLYNIGHSVLRHQGPNPAPVDTPVYVEPETASASIAYGAVAAQAAPKAVFMAAAEPEVKAEETPAVAKQEVPNDTEIYLFKTPTCPNCKAAAVLLDKAGIKYTALNADENKELVEAFGVKQAPTLVLKTGETFEKYRGVSDIKGWLMKN
jgi:ribonucleoside-triphosphate reductase